MPLKGWHHSEESKRKMSESHRGFVPWNKGITYTEHQKRNLYGHAPWNTGKRLPEALRAKLSQRHKGYQPSKETRQRMSQAQSGKILSEAQKSKIAKSHLGIKPSIETRQKLSESHKGYIMPSEQRRKIGEGNKRAFLEGRRRFHVPNKAEQHLESLLNQYFPNEWKFVGDGQIVIGGLNPDFINCNGKKLIIELFGEPWHGKKWPVPYYCTEYGRTEVYSRYGFRTLIIWSEKLRRGKPEEIVERIKEFINECSQNPQHWLLCP